MSKIRIGSKTYHDQLANLSGMQLRDAIETAKPFRATLRSPDRGAYGPSKPIAIEVQQPSGDSRLLVVKPTDLTERGIGCLVGLYLYGGLECTVHLVTSDGEHLTVAGRTENCVFLGNRAHFLSVGFDRPVDLDLFFPPEVEERDDPPEGIACLSRIMGQIDGQMDHPLLQDLVTILRAEASRLAGEESILNANEILTPVRIAVVSYNGNILAVNPAWLVFAVESGYAGSAFSTHNYLRHLEAHLDSCTSVPPVLEAFRATTAGESKECRYAYCCQSDAGRSDFFLVRHSAQIRMRRRVVVVSHMPIDGAAIDEVRDAA